MASRLPLIREPTKHWVNWAPRIGGRASHSRIMALYPNSRETVWHPEPSDRLWARQHLQPPWWRRWVGSHPTFAAGIHPSADMVWCNMQLHMSPDPLTLMTTWHQALHAQGHVMFSCLGPDSLLELRQVFEQNGWPSPHHPFTDMHDWGDMLLQAGFAQPVMDMEHITLTYARAEDVLRDLRTLGRNLHPMRFAGCRGREWRQQLLRDLSEKLASPAHPGRLALTVEVIYGHAFKAPPVAAVADKTVVTLADMKKMLSGNSHKKPLDI